MVYKINHFTFVIKLKNMKAPFDQTASLRLINEMIANAKHKFSEADSYYFLFWGYFTLFVLATYYIMAAYIDPNMAHFVWLLFALGSIANFFINKKLRSEKIVVTQIDKVIGNLWKSFGISAITLLVAGYFIQWLVMPVILICMGIVLLAHGLIISFRAFQIGGVFCTLGALISFILGNELILLPIFAACILIGYIVPGHLLKSAGSTNQ